jgi:hypothetical protein
MIIFTLLTIAFSWLQIPGIGADGVCTKWKGKRPYFDDPNDRDPEWCGHQSEKDYKRISILYAHVNMAQGIKEVMINIHA